MGRKKDYAPLVHIAGLALAKSGDAQFKELQETSRKSYRLAR